MINIVLINCRNYFKVITILAVFLALNIDYVIAQQKRIQVSGIVKDSDKNVPIEFVNIGIENTVYGGASFEDGTFKISIPNSFFNDTLTFSAIGYKKKKVPLSQFINTLEALIKMERDIIQMEEIVVFPQKPKIITDGITRAGFGFMRLSKRGIFIPSEDGGSAMSILLNERSKQVLIDKVALFIHKNTFEKFQLRVRFLRLENEKPGSDLYKENIIIASSVEEGKIEIDLVKRSIVIKEPFFLFSNGL